MSCNYVTRKVEGLDDAITHMSDLQQALSRLWYYQGNINKSESLYPYDMANSSVNRINVVLHGLRYRSTLPVDNSMYEMLVNQVISVFQHIQSLKYDLRQINAVVEFSGNCMSRRCMVAIHVSLECFVVDMERVKNHYDIYVRPIFVETKPNPRTIQDAHLIADAAIADAILIPDVPVVVADGVRSDTQSERQSKNKAHETDT